MNIDHVGLSLKLVLQAPEAASAARALGKRIAVKVDAYVRTNDIGYYPALDYFLEIDGFDRSLLDTARQMAWHNSREVRTIIESRLKPVFSTVKFQSIQTQAFNLPPVRPRQGDALARLARHYSPDAIRVDMVVSMMRRDNDRRSDGAEGYTRKMVFRWLSEAFDSVEITSSMRVEN